MPTHSETDVLCFLFDKRLELFNLRRDHEWKIFFGVISLVGVVDIALITGKIALTVAAALAWRIMLAVLFIASVAYQFGVQTRNRVDRLAMDELYLRLCEAGGVPRRSVIRAPVDRSSEERPKPGRDSVFRYTYLWAFAWQTLVLLVVCIISWYVPAIIPPADTGAGAGGQGLAPPGVAAPSSGP